MKNLSISPEMLRFYEKLYGIQNNFYSRLQDSAALTFKADNNLPALKSGSINFDDFLKRELDSMLKAITDLIVAENSGLDFSTLLEMFSDISEGIFSELLNRDYEALQKRASSCRLDFDEFIFVIHNLFKPLVVFLRESSGFKPESDEDWLEGNCPFCGYFPGMSKIVGAKENQRILSCSLCEHEWKFLRLTCFVCGNKDQEKQGYFESENNSLYRAYYCDECKSYIKTLNVTRAQDESGFDLHVEDILTTSLDAAMLDKGYNRP